MTLIVGLEDFPSSWRHEAGGRNLVISSHLSHAGSTNELEFSLVGGLWVEELHSLGRSVVGSDLEGKDLDALEHGFAVDEELLTVPHIVAIDTVLLWVLNTSGVTASDEVGDTAVNTGRGVPQDLGGATVVHWRWPDGEDCVIWVEGSVVQEGLMLSHTVGEGNIVVLAPSTKRVKKEDWVAVSLADELFTGILKEKNVTIVEWVTDLEGVDNIGILLGDLFLNLLWHKAVLIVSIVEDGALGESHGGSRNEEVSLSEDGLGARVVGRHAAESTGADLFLAVVEEAWVLNDGEDIIRADSGALDCDLGLSLELSLLLSSDGLGDGDGEKVSLALIVSDGLHVHDLKELELVHESLERSGPAVTNGLEVLNLVLGDVEGLEGAEFSGLLSGSIAPHGLSDDTLLVGAEDTVLSHVLDNNALALLEGELTSVNVHLWGLGSLIRVRDTGELGNNTSAGLGVKSLNITAFANLEGGRDMALVELESSVLVDGASKASIGGVWADESDEHNLSSHAEELGDLSDSADVLGTVLLGETEILVEASTDNISVKKEDLLAVTDKLVDLLLEGTGESGLTSTGKTSEPVGGTSLDGHGGGIVVDSSSFDHCEIGCESVLVF